MGGTEREAGGGDVVGIKRMKSLPSTRHTTHASRDYTL